MRPRALAANNPHPPDDFEPDRQKPLDVIGASASAGPRDPSSAHAPAKTSQPPAVGKLFGNYEILSEVSRGSFGVVYRARQKGLERVAALKVLLAGAHASPEAVARFQREARAVARLKHPHIVPIYDIGEQEGHHYFAMEFVDGESLSALIAKKSLGLGEALALAESLADAIESAHGAGVVHRDLKPSNILVDKKGVPHITDFGLAKQTNLDTQYTQSGTTLGTPAYMPPEQARGEVNRIDARSDVYALGAVLYEMLTGSAPFAGRSLLEVVIAVINEPVRPPRQINPKIHRDIQTIVLKCLEKDSHNRYASAAELRDDIRRFRSGEAIRAKPVGLLRQAGRLAKKHSFFLGAVATVLAAVGYSVWQIRDQRLKAERRDLENLKQRREEERDRELKEQKASESKWKRYWWFPVTDETALTPEELALFKRGFVRPKLARDPMRPGVPDWNWDEGRPFELPLSSLLVSPEGKLIIGDLEAKIAFRLPPAPPTQSVRVGMQSFERGIPYVLALQPGRLSLAAPVDLYNAIDAGKNPLLQVKAEKRGVDLVAGEYQVLIRREGMLLTFEVTPPSPTAPLRLCVWDVGLSHWIFQNTQLTLREPPAGLQVLSAEVRCKISPERSDKIAQALNYFYEGKYNYARFNFESIAEDKSGMKEEKDFLKVAQACYYLGLIREIERPGAKPDAPYYDQAQDLLDRCRPSPDRHALETRVRLRRLLRAFTGAQWDHFDGELDKLGKIEGALGAAAASDAGLGEPFAWELQPILHAVLKNKEDPARALALFTHLGLPPGSTALDQAAATLAQALVSLDRVPELKALQRTYPAGQLLPAFAAAVQRSIALPPYDDQGAFETLRYAVQNFPGPEAAEPLDKAGAALLSFCIRAKRFPTARGILDLLPHPPLLAPLNRALAETAKDLLREELEQVLGLLKPARKISESAPGPLAETVLAGLAGAQHHELAATFYGLARTALRGETARLFPLLVGALEKIKSRDLLTDQEVADEKARDKILKELKTTLALTLEKDPAEERQTRLELADLLLALGRADETLDGLQRLHLELLRETPAERGGEQEILAGVALRIATLRTLKEPSLYNEIWKMLVSETLYPEEARLAGKYMMGSIRSSELEAEQRRIGGPLLISEAEWDLLKAIRLRYEQDVNGSAAALQEAVKKSEPARAWPGSLAKLLAKPGEAPKEPPKDLSP